MPKSFSYRASRNFNATQRDAFVRAVEEEYGGKFTIEWSKNHEPIFLSTAENHPTDTDLQHFVAGYYHAVNE
jgi:hypothetical protein